MIPITAALAELFSDTVTLRAPVTKDGFGKVTLWGSPVTVAARVSGQRRIVRDTAGKERVSNVRVWIKGVYGIKTDWEITLPARCDPQQPAIISVHVIPDENGPHHEVLNLGNAGGGAM